MCSNSDKSLVDKKAKSAKRKTSQRPKVRQMSGFSSFNRNKRLRRRLMTREEYERLRLMVPSVSGQPQVSKVQVIEEAIKYIDSLHLALFERLRAQRNPPGSQPQSGDEHLRTAELKAWIEQLLPSPSLVSPQRQLVEKSNKSPSFLHKVNRMARKKH